MVFPKSKCDGARLVAQKRCGVNVGYLFGLIRWRRQAAASMWNKCSAGVVLLGCRNTGVMSEVVERWLGVAACGCDFLMKFHGICTLSVSRVVPKLQG